MQRSLVNLTPEIVAGRSSGRIERLIHVINCPPRRERTISSSGRSTKPRTDRSHVRVNPLAAGLFVDGPVCLHSRRTRRKREDSIARASDAAAIVLDFRFRRLLITRGVPLDQPPRAAGTRETILGTGSDGKRGGRINSPSASLCLSYLLLSLSVPSINQRGGLIVIPSEIRQPLPPLPSRRRRGRWGRGRQTGRQGSRTARRGMLRGLTVSRAFERSDFTATVFSNDFPPLKTFPHPPSIHRLTLSSFPSFPFVSLLSLSLSLTLRVDGLLPPPTPRRCPPAWILSRDEGRDDG